MSKLEKYKFLKIKKAISKELALFCFNYLQLKRKVHDTMKKTFYVNPYNQDFGYYEDPQAPNTWSCYADIAMETLLTDLKQKIEKEIDIKLIETYAYTRLYKNGDELVRHKDRSSCEISTTLNLGGDPWPIFIEKDIKKGKLTGGIYYAGNTKGEKILLNPGDLLIYKGSDCEHWREPFKGSICGQVFLHYNRASRKENIYDNRPHLGLPFFYINRNE